MGFEDLLLPLPELGTGLSDCDLGLSLSNDYLPGMVDGTKWDVTLENTTLDTKPSGELTDAPYQESPAETFLKFPPASKLDLFDDDAVRHHFGPARTVGAPIVVVFNFTAPVNNVAASNVITHGANVIGSSADSSAGSLEDAIDRLALETIKTREETNRTLEVFGTVSKGELESFKRKGAEVLKTSKRKMKKKFDKMMARWEEKADKHFQSIKKRKIKGGGKFKKEHVSSGYSEDSSSDSDNDSF